jgi:hypothetical protein
LDQDIFSKLFSILFHELKIEKPRALFVIIFVFLARKSNNDNSSKTVYPY